MEPDQLIRAARRQVDPSVNPTQEELKRAVSTTYYALFHTLSNACADLLAGASHVERASDEWTQAYRALDHRQIRRQCSRAEISRYHLGIRYFDKTFCTSQEYRHDADYSPRANFSQARVDSIIDDAASAMVAFASAPEDERRRFIVYLALRRR